MYGVKFSLWLTGAVGPRAVAGRHSSTQPLAGRDRCRPSRQDQRFHRRKPNYRHTGPDCTSIGELKNLDINYHLQSYVMDRSMVFFKNLGGC